MSEQSETPIGDQVESEVLAPGLVRGIAPHGTSDEQIQLTDPYTIPGEDDPDDPEAETATEADDQVEASDNSGEPEAGDEPQAPDAVQDNAGELDGDEPAADGS